MGNFLHRQLDQGELARFLAQKLSGADPEIIGGRDGTNPQRLRIRFQRNGGRWKTLVRQRPQQLLPVWTKTRIRRRPARAGKIRKRNPLAPGERVTGGRKDHILIIVQMFLDDIRRRRRTRTGDEKIDLPFAQHVHEYVPMAAILNSKPVIVV